MFTGIIKQLGRVEATDRVSGGLRIVVAPAAALGDLEIGESIAVDGVCLTAEPDSTAGRIVFFLSGETLAKTTFGDVAPGASVNMERSLSVGDRMGGHFVMGHVDCVGAIQRLDAEGESWTLEVAFPDSFRRYLVPKGSVAVDGISLTVAELGASTFSVAIIPHTLEQTSLNSKSTASRVNLEADTIGRYVVDYLSKTESKNAVDADLLKKAGFC